MRRLGLALVVSLLAFSATGITSVLVSEPCSAVDAGGQDDERTCPPLCVTCGCCAQAAEPATLIDTPSPESPVARTPHALPRPLTPEPRAILHVPKSPV